MSRLVKIGFASIDTHVGNMRGNLKKALRVARKGHRDGATIVVMQEQGFAGYSSEDLVQFGTFVDAQLRTFQEFVTAAKALSPVYVVGVTIPFRGHVFNCAAVVYRGKVVGIVPKEKLPNYGIFHELREFTPGYPGMNEKVRLLGESTPIPFGDLVFDFPFGTMAVEVCEDIWSPNGPMSRRAFDADIVVNISSSPFRGGVLGTRREVVATRSSDNQVVAVYTNQYGGQDSNVFDGGGFVYQNGRLLVEAKRWQESYTSVVVDLDETVRSRRENTTWRRDWCDFQGNGRIPKPHHVVEDKWSASSVEGLVLPVKDGNPFIPQQAEKLTAEEEYFSDLISVMQTGLAGYFEKTGAFERIAIALSGGKDSYLTLLVAYSYARQKFDKLPAKKRVQQIRDFIHCVSMPSNFNSDTTKSIARLVCEELGVTFIEQSIEEAFQLEVAAQKQLTGADELPTLVLENIQPRIRAARMWNYATQVGALFLHTGNMSENAVGYTTVGGDMEGGYSLIGNLPKSVINRLLEDISESYEGESLKMLLGTEASAELREGQEDEKDLMPFEILDEQLNLFAGRKLGPVEIYRTLRSKYSGKELRALDPSYKKGDLKRWVKYFVHRFFRMEFKRVRQTLSVHLGSVDLDRERSLFLVVALSLDWLQDELDELDKLP